MIKLLLLCVTSIFLIACDGANTPQKTTPQLLIYCGITMIHPIKDIAAIVEKEKNVKIVISQGGSEDLYKSLAHSRQGDLYLPGSASYRDKHIDEGLLGEAVNVGYNQVSLIVNKNNPKNIQAKVTELLRTDLAIVIGNANTGSIGRETKRILDKQGIYQEVLENAVFVTTDSRNLNKALINNEADAILNWKATAYFSENKDFMEVIDLDTKLAIPKKLLLNKLSFSKYPEISQYFMDLAASERGQAIFRSYGFLDNTMAK